VRRSGYAYIKKCAAEVKGIAAPQH